MPAKKVMIVEDNEDNRLIYRAVLNHFGYEVLTAGDGVEGLALAQDQLPDLVLLDISLPLLSGWEVATELLAAERTRHIIIVGLSAHTDPAHAKRAQELGFRSYIRKPVSPRSVVAEIERLLGTGSEPEPPRQGLQA